MLKPMLACVLLLPAFGNAKGDCRWMNQATAAGVLNGPVSMDVQNTGDMVGSCTFRLMKEPNAYGLRIVVEKGGEMEKGMMMTHGARCASSAIPLQAIGNEAVMCIVKIGHSRGEQVVGRVRDQVFVVSLDAPMSGNRSMNEELLEEKAASVAEQVAGAMY